MSSAWTDLARAARRLPAGTVLDGEAVVYVAGQVDFRAAQARAASSAARAAHLAARQPASFAAWDILAHAELGDVRSRPYVERRALLLDVLEDVGPPLQVVPATDDRGTALVWCEALRAQGVEGLVAKHATSTYRAATSRPPDWTLPAAGHRDDAGWSTRDPLVRVTLTKPFPEVELLDSPANVAFRRYRGAS